jgi:hypothetical protein
LRYTANRTAPPADLLSCSEPGLRQQNIRVDLRLTFSAVFRPEQVLERCCAVLEELRPGLWLLQ